MHSGSLGEPHFVSAKSIHPHIRLQDSSFAASSVKVLATFDAEPDKPSYRSTAKLESML